MGKCAATLPVCLAPRRASSPSASSVQSLCKQRPVPLQAAPSPSASSAHLHLAAVRWVEAAVLPVGLLPKLLPVLGSIHGPAARGVRIGAAVWSVPSCRGCSLVLLLVKRSGRCGSARRAASVGTTTLRLLRLRLLRLRLLLRLLLRLRLRGCLLLRLLLLLPLLLLRG